MYKQYICFKIVVIDWKWIRNKQEKEEKKMFRRWKEQQMEQALARIGEKDTANQPGSHRTRSTSTWERGKETREQGSQTEDIRKEARTFRPDEIKSPIRQKQRIRHRNGWKKKQEETSRKMNEMNVEGRLSDVRNWKPTPVLDFLIDTGASKSFISDQYYRQHLGNVKLTPHYVNVSAVNGNKMNVLGKCKLTMELHGRKIQHQFIVTNVKEDAILGFDFLEEHQVRWNWTTRTLEVDQEQFPCKMGDMTTKVHRIITQQLSIIPPNSEMIVSGFVKDKRGHGTMGIIEGQQRFLQEYPVAIAAVITRKQKNSVPILVIFASHKPVVISKRVGIAMLVPGEVLEAEDVRRANSANEGNQPEKWRKMNGTKQEDRNQLPPELEEMITTTGTHLEEEDMRTFRKLVEQYKEQFMLKNGAMGRTTLVQHEIHTMEKTANKQRPR